MPKIHAIKPGEEFEVTLPSESDVKVEERTVFVITSPDVRDFARIQNELYDVRGIGKSRKERFRTGEHSLEILKLGLRGWKNFMDHDGKEIKWRDSGEGNTPQERERILIENINRIPEANRAELVDLIRGEATASQD